MIVVNVNYIEQQIRQEFNEFYENYCEREYSKKNVK
jgi:hypothetical protein